MLHETFQHQIGCKNFHKRLHVLTVTFLLLSTTVCFMGLGETMVWMRIRKVAPDLCDETKMDCKSISPSIFFGAAAFIPPILSFCVIQGYTERVRLSLIIFIGVAATSVASALALTLFSTLKLTSMLSLNLALCDLPGEESELMEQVNLKTSFRRQSNSDMIIEVDTVDKIYQGCSESNVYAAYMTWILILELVLGISQLLVALVSVVVVTTNKPLNGMKKRMTNTIGRLKSMKLACGCSMNTFEEKDSDYPVSRVNYGFRDFHGTLEKVTNNVDDDQFLSHLESLPTKFTRSTRGSSKSTSSGSTVSSVLTDA
ncbi:Oidioi.mRNA.OKI2018_I69.chr1.g2945.t1.cds [Oikopleura dioica]|uniref:Oidioi.mRNA.OKI2018_I69.chr1.g2945.t1.cds n=1 Tax=Oikopleura dioica TaxID=34765 RepID=A0ABN7SXY6_OIKDI|nr:Oidioi.mRNA.OKI2018_I69.chr1.g2945.t1.cds [Oikopleura dioica]